ncbi:MAG: CopG family ribbon-helix-helix protein [Selenomonadaceae bacterium]
MTELKRVMISIPDEMLEEIDSFAATEKLSRSQFFRDAMGNYIEDCKHRAFVENMKKGYEEMAVINLTLAEEGLFAEMAGRG